MEKQLGVIEKEQKSKKAAPPPPVAPTHKTSKISFAPEPATTAENRQQRQNNGCRTESPTDADSAFCDNLSVLSSASSSSRTDQSKSNSSSSGVSSNTASPTGVNGAGGINTADQVKIIQVDTMSLNYFLHHW